MIRQKTAPSLKNRFQLTQVNYNISRCTINIFFCFGDMTDVSRISKISFCGFKQILKSLFNPCMIANPLFFRNRRSSFAHLSWFPRFVIIQAQRQRQITFMFLYSKDRSFDPRSKKNDLLTFLCLKIDFIH